MVSTRADHERPPAPVAESWRRIEASLDDHLPILKRTLRPGIAKKDLAKFERLVGRQLPDDVRESWMIHDGQRRIEHLGGDDPMQLEGLFFGNDLMPLLDDEDCLPSQPSFGQWEFWAEMVDEAERGEDGGMLDEFAEESTSSPSDAIRRLHASRAWIPLVEITDSDHIGIDLDPGPNGVVGQVINFGRDEKKRYVLARSWAQFLEDFADELEAGNFTIRLRKIVKKSKRVEKVFEMKEPSPGTLHWNLKEWSKAKVAWDLGKDA